MLRRRPRRCSPCGGRKAADRSDRNKSALATCRNPVKVWGGRATVRKTASEELRRVRSPPRRKVRVTMSTIRASLGQIKGSVALKSTKTDRTRIVPISESTRRAFLKQEEQQEADRVRLGTPTKTTPRHPPLPMNLVRHLRLRRQRTLLRGSQRKPEYRPRPFTAPGQFSCGVVRVVDRATLAVRPQRGNAPRREIRSRPLPWQRWRRRPWDKESGSTSIGSSSSKLLGMQRPNGSGFARCPRERDTRRHRAPSATHSTPQPPCAPQRRGGCCRGGWDMNPTVCPQFVL